MNWPATAMTIREWTILPQRAFARMFAARRPPSRRSRVQPYGDTALRPFRSASRRLGPIKSLRKRDTRIVQASTPSATIFMVPHLPHVTRSDPGPDRFGNSHSQPDECLAKIFHVPGEGIFASSLIGPHDGICLTSMRPKSRASSTSILGKLMRNSHRSEEHTSEL